MVSLVVTEAESQVLMVRYTPPNGTNVHTVKMLKPPKIPY